MKLVINLFMLLSHPGSIVEMQHCTNYLRSWLPVPERIHYKILLLTFKALHGLAPHYLSELLKLKDDNTSTTMTLRNHGYQPTRHTIQSIIGSMSILDFGDHGPPSIAILCVSCSSKIVYLHPFADVFKPGGFWSASSSLPICLSFH